jgi:hypothetical protein
MKSQNQNLIFAFWKILPNLLWLLAALYSFLAFFSVPLGIHLGLDGSWGYAISKAAEQRLIFGEDVIFTYGPFGYLTHGVVFSENYWSVIIFRLIVYFTLFTVTLAKISTIKNYFIKLSLGFSILFLSLKYLTCDYQLLIIFLLIISSKSIWKSKIARVLPLCLGTFAGFCLLTKLTLGLYTIGSLILILSAKVYDSIKMKLNRESCLFYLIETLLSTISVAFIFLNPNYYKINLLKVIILLILSVILSVAAKLANFLIAKTKLRSTNHNILFDYKLFYLCYFLGLGTLIIYSSPSLIAYLKGSWEISSGYSSAMSLIGPVWELGLGISQIILISIALFLIAKEGNIGIAFCLALVLFLSFKHGFVRQDSYHTFVFFSLTPIITAIAMTQIQKKMSYFFVFVYTYTLLILLIMPSVSVFLEELSPKNVFTNAIFLQNLNQLKKDINTSNEMYFSLIKLPSQFMEIVKEKPIDIVPWEISLVPANNLNWQPRPIFQSYSAYTSFLDRQNFLKLSKKPPNYILYQFSSIDNRHPFFDEPETFSYIFCNYKLSSNLADFVHTKKVLNLLLLEKRPSNICLLSSPTQELNLKWKKNIVVDEKNTLLRGSFKINYSVIGKIYKTLFRSPPVMIHITYKNGQETSYRIIPENAENGVIISHLPINDREGLSFFNGKLPNRVQSFQFSTVNPILYKQDIKMNITPISLLDKSIKDDEWIDISSLKNINFLTNKTDTFGYLDTQNKAKDRPFKRGDKINLIGWAASKVQNPKRTWILITCGLERTPLAITRTGLNRYDVAESLKNSRYLTSGWSVDINSENMPVGVHDIMAWIYDSTTNHAIPINGSYRVHIN